MTKDPENTNKHFPNALSYQHLCRRNSDLLLSILTTELYCKYKNVHVAQIL